MDATDPILIIAAASLVAMGLAPFASYLIGSAASRLSAELSDNDDDLSRIR